MSSLQEDCALLARRLVEEYRARGASLATAESCTGGLICHLITNVAGSSDVLMGGCVVYSNAAKEDLLGVSPIILDDDGAVSEACVLAMADGVRKRFACDFGIAVSGIAGPGGGSEAKPVGTVWLALATEEATQARLFHFSHERLGNKWASAYEALQWLMDP
jgi:nicotinamide-nucleotide amidase